jgi:mannose-6-phosphate isomerase
MTLGDEETEELVRALTEWARKDESPEASLVRRFYDLHGVDRGVAAPLYLNVLTLEEGEALFQPAGVLHAYVEGMGVELMANSDNVLRGGLTKKHVDVEELLGLLSFSPRRPDVIQPQEVSPGIEEYPVPIDEFLLRRVRPSRTSSPEGVELENRSSLDIGICVSGNARILDSGAKSDAKSGANTEGDGGSLLDVGKGESFVVPYAMGGYRISGDAVIYMATIPLDWP